MGIVWLPSAINDLISLLQRIEGMFGRIVANEVRQRIMSHINLLASFPHIGVCDSDLSEENREVRYLVNTPNVIYYIVSEDEVVIISIFDSRQSPEMIRQKICEIIKEK